MTVDRDTRRALLKYLAASPLLAALGSAACADGEEDDEREAEGRMGTLGEQMDSPIIIAPTAVRRPSTRTANSRPLVPPRRRSIS